MQNSIKGKLHILSTNKSSVYHLVPKGELETINSKLMPTETDRILITEEPTEFGYTPVEVYITLPYDDNNKLTHININDWVLDDRENMIRVNEAFLDNCSHEFGEFFNKIIATTDNSLNLYESENLAQASGFSLKTKDLLLPSVSLTFLQELPNIYKGESLDVEIELDFRECVYIKNTCAESPNCGQWVFDSSKQPKNTDCNQRPIIKLNSSNEINIKLVEKQDTWDDIIKNFNNIGWSSANQLDDLDEFQDYLKQNYLVPIKL